MTPSPFLLLLSLLLALGAWPGLAQVTTGSVPRPLEIIRAYNITSSSQIQDNRSATQSCNIFTYDVQSGTGAWSVQLEYADAAPTGPWTSFGQAAVVTSTTAPPVGIGSGYHNWVRLHTTAGSTVTNLSCEKDFWLPVVSSGAGAFDCPLVSPTQTGCLTGAEFSALLAKQDATYTPPSTGGTAEPLTQIFTNGCDGIDATAFGVSSQNPDNLVALTNALAAASSQNAGIVCAPGGSFLVSNTVDIPNKVQIRGRGRGDTGGLNTSIVANASFPANSPVLTIGSLTGPNFVPHFGTRIDNLSVDCAGHPGCIAIQDNYGEEQSGGDHLLMANASVCLQVNGSDLPQSGRVQNEYGWHDTECFPNQYALPTTPLMQFNNVQEGLGAERMSVVGQFGHPFGYCVQASGDHYHLKSIHCEQATIAGVLLGPQGSVGAPGLVVDDVVMSTGSSGVPVEISYNGINYPAGLVISNVSQNLSGQVSFACGTVQNDFNGTCLNTPYYTVGNQQSGNGPIFDLGYGNTWNLENPILNYYSYTGLADGNAGKSVLDLKNSVTYLGWPFQVKQDGTLDLGDGGVEGAGDINFHNPRAKLCIDSSGNNACSGMNLQSILTPDFTQGILFNSYFNPTANAFTLVGDGSGWIGGLVGINPGGPMHLSNIAGGIGFVSDYGLSTPAVQTPAQFAQHIKTIIPGWGGIQFIRSTQPGCGLDQRGTLYFNRDTNNSLDTTSICAYAGGALGWQSLGGSAGGVNATSIQGVPVSASAPTLNYVLAFNGTAWVPTSVTASTVNGAAVPANAPCVGTNGSAQFVTTTCGTAGTSVTLQTSGVNNLSQTTLNLSGAGGAVVTNTNAGNVLITTPTAPLFQTSGTNNGAQTGLNIAVAGTLSVANTGSTVTITGTGSGQPSGVAGGDLAGTYPNPVSAAWSDASDFPSVQAACTAAGSTGTVLIRATYAGTDTTWNCGTTQVIDQRNTNYTVWNAHQFGLTGNGAVLTDGTLTGGTAVLGSAGQHCFTAADNNKHVKVQGGNSTGAISVLPTNDLIGSIVSTAACKATLSVASTGTGALTGLQVFYATDDSAAFTALLAQINTRPLGTAQIYFPGGIYALAGPFYVTQGTMLRGDGINTSSLRDIHPTNDFLLWKFPGAGVTPNAFPIPGVLRDINIQGEGTSTTGNLLVVAISSLQIDSVSFTGHNGPAIANFAERSHFNHIRERNTKRALYLSPNWPSNESYLDDFDLMDTGCIVDSLLSNGLYYNTNENSVNGIYPGMNASGNSDGTPGPYPLTQTQHTAIYLDGVTNWTISHGSIKPTRCAGGITVAESNGDTEISHVYFENGGSSGGYIAPDVINGGSHLHSTIMTGISASASFVDIADGSWMGNFLGNATDAALATYGSTPQTQYAIYPPDFSYGSVTPSVIGGGILQGSFELGTNNGGVHDGVGSGWHAGLGRKAGSLAWPAGAIYEQIFLQSGTGITISDSHLHGDSLDTGSRYTVTCNPNTGLACGAVVNGLVADPLHAWNTPLSQNNFSRGITLRGSIAMSPEWTDNTIGGTIENHNNANVDTTGVNHTTQLSNGQPLQTGGADGTVFQVPEIKSRLRRVVYSSGNLPNSNYAGPFTALNFSPQPTGNYQGATVVPSNNTSSGPLFQYTSRYQIGDQVNGATSNPNNIFQFQGDATGFPGLFFNQYNPTAANYSTIFNLQGTTQAQFTGGMPLGAQLSLNDGGTNTAMGAVFNDAVQFLSIKNVNAPTVTPTGGAAGAYSYAITACAVDATCTAAANVASIANGPTTLTPTAFNTLTWAAPQGNAAYYNVWRTGGGGLSTGKINTAPILSGTTTFVDTGLAGTGNPPSNNITGALLIAPSNTQYPAGHLEVDGDAGNVLIRGDGTLALIPTGTQPACTVSERGSFWYTNAASGTADTVQTCSKTVTNAYAWTALGGTGGGTPGGSPNAVQYNAAGVFAGLLNATATPEFLTQTSSGTPTFAALTVANLPTAIPLANLAPMAANSVLGNSTASTAIPAPLTVPTLNTLLGSAPATTTTFGVVKCDGISVLCTAGVLSSASPAFGAIGAGTNTNALTIGAGGTLTTSGNGIINATQVNGLAMPVNAPCVGTNGSAQFVLANCGSGGGGNLITSPFTTLSVGGTSTASTLDLNPAAGIVTPAAALGFKCDGISDDSAHFNNAATAGLTIQLPDSGVCMGFNLAFVNNVRYLGTNASIRHLPSDTTHYLINSSATNVSFRGITFDFNGMNNGSYTGANIATTAVTVSAGGSGFPANKFIAMSFTGGGCLTEPSGYATVNGSGNVSLVTLVQPGGGCTSAPTSNTNWTSAAACPAGGCVAPTLAITAPANLGAPQNYFGIFLSAVTNFHLDDCQFISTGSSLANLSADIGGILMFRGSGRIDGSTITNTIQGFQIKYDAAYIAGTVAGHWQVTNNAIDRSGFYGIEATTSNTTDPTGNIEIASNTITNIYDALQGTSTGSAGNAIEVYRMAYADVHDNKIWYPRYSGVRVTGSSGGVSTARYNNIYSNLIVGAGEAALFVELGAENNAFHDNVIQNCSSGIDATNIGQRPTGSKNLITTNIFQGCNNYAIHAEHDDVLNNILIDDVVGVRVGFSGVAAAETISGNTLRSSGIAATTALPAYPMGLGISVDPGITANGILIGNNDPEGATIAPALPVPNGPALSLCGITQASPAVVTFCSAPGGSYTLASGQTWLLTNIQAWQGFGSTNTTNMTQANGLLCTASATSSTTMTCGAGTAINSSAFTAFASNPQGNSPPAAYLLYSSGTTPAWSWPATVATSSGLGTSGYVATSNGTGQAPTWQPQTGGVGGSTTSSLNGGTPCTIVAGNCNLQIPVPIAGPGIAIVSAGSGNSQTATWSTTSPVDTQVSNGGGYTVPAADCTGNGGLLIFTGTATMNLGVPQAGLSGNFQRGCKFNVINQSTGAVTISFTTSNWNTVSGTSAIILGARSGGTVHMASIYSDGSDYTGVQQ